jgi:Disulphide bond corrector protein DsbC
MHLNRMLVLIPLVAVAFAFASAPAAPASAQKWYEKAVKKVSAEISPAEAKPGQTVTLSVTIELNEGYHTYPTVQTDKAAASMVNVFKFPAPGTVIFVGTLEDPKDPKTKAEPDAGITELRYYEGKVTFTRKAVVSPKATAGPATVKLTKFSLSVCDKEFCFPAKDVPVEATVKVLDGPAVPVEKEFAEEVKKALGEK